MSPIEVTLPKTGQTGTNEWADVEDNDLALKAGIKEASEQAESATALTWYTPKVIATEQTRESASYGTLTTADEIKSVVLPENGLICIGYIGLIKSSVGGAGRVTLFLSANQVKVAGSTTPVGAERETVGTGFTTFVSSHRGFYSSGGSGALVTTGMTLGASVGTDPGGLCYVFAAAGTYDISVQYKATSGSITAKERKLWVGVLG